ncbi:YMGG-like glycine zipper-containing protein [Streptomyces sp. TRM76130]|nr:YMGG-like glycine zipper-containing protein [Streptomyces sp. TRM76130]
MLFALIGAVLGTVLSLAFGFIGTPWQGALVMGAIGAVVGLIQPPLNRAVRRSVYRD